MGSQIIADAAATWAAVGSIGSAIAAATAIAIAATLTRRQTALTDRAAQNARVSADAAVSATRTAREALDVASAQLQVARDGVKVAQDSAAAAWNAVRSGERPLLAPASFVWREEDRHFVFCVNNLGRGAGKLVSAVLRGPGSPVAFEIEAAVQDDLVPVGQQSVVLFAAPPGLLSAPRGPYAVVGEIETESGDHVPFSWSLQLH